MREALGEVTLPSAEVQALLVLTAEQYPIHHDSAFAAAAPAGGLLIPGVLLWAVAEALEAKALGPVAWRALPSLDADYLRPVLAGRYAFEAEVLPNSTADDVRVRWRARDERGDAVAIAVRRGAVER